MSHEKSVKRLGILSYHLNYPLQPTKLIIPLFSRGGYPDQKLCCNILPSPLIGCLFRFPIELVEVESAVESAVEAELVVAVERFEFDFVLFYRASQISARWRSSRFC